MDTILDLLIQIRDIVALNDRPSLAAKADHLIELRRRGDEGFAAKFNSGYFWGASGMNESAAVWAVNCKYRTKEYLQAVVELEKAMRTEGMQNKVAEWAAEMYQKILDGEK